MMTGYKQLLTVGLLTLGSGVALAQTTPNALVINDDGNVGMGTATPERQLHLKSDNAVFRMDRPSNSAAFMLVRTTAAGTPQKTFVVGTDASGTNNGEFIINDLGTAVSGGGTRRLTITNAGEAIFTGTVRAPAFVTPSSRRFKQDIMPLADALAVVSQLQGVHFVWKDTGQQALGLIAEDVAPVLPEVVERDAEDGQTAGVNYMALVAVLVEAIKEQQAEIAAYRAEVAGQQAKVGSLEARLAELESAQAKIASLEARLAGFETVKVRLAEIEGLLVGEGLRPVLTQR